MYTPLLSDLMGPLMEPPILTLLPDDPFRLGGRGRFEGGAIFNIDLGFLTSLGAGGDSSFFFFFARNWSLGAVHFSPLRASIVGKVTVPSSGCWRSCKCCNVSCFFCASILRKFSLFHSSLRVTFLLSGQTTWKISTMETIRLFTSYTQNLIRLTCWRFSSCSFVCSINFGSYKQ